MSRQIRGRYILTGSLRATTAVHVGGLHDDPLLDLTIVRDGRGRSVLPGTSIAGALRARTLQIEPGVGQAAHGSDSPAAALWGLPPQVGAARGGDADHNGGHASFVTVEDAPVRDAAAAPGIDIRDGVGIERRTATAAPQVKFDREVLPAGTTFAFRLVVDVPRAWPGYLSDKSGGWDTPDVVAEQMVRTLLRDLVDGALRVGAASSRGLGGIALVDAHLAYDDYTTRTGLLAALRGQSPKVTEAASPEGQAAATWQRPPQLGLSLSWAPTGALFVKDGAHGSFVDILPLVARQQTERARDQQTERDRDQQTERARDQQTERDRDQQTERARDQQTECDRDVALLLPGSGIKGALRSHAERIERTISGQHAPEAVDGTGFLDQLEATRLSAGLFGTAAAHGEGGERHGEGPPRGAGAVRIRDVLSKSRLPEEAWDKVVGATKESPDEDLGELQRHLDRVGGAHGPAHAPPESPARWEITDHVAIDRWTAAPKDTALYNILEPHHVVWEPIELTLDLNRLMRNLGERDARAAVVLLLLTLEDFAAGMVPLGYGAAKGYGDLKVTRVTVHPHQLDTLLDSEEQKFFADGPDVPASMDLDAIESLTALVEEAVRSDWQAWCTAADAHAGQAEEEARA